ncbi:hypothetical protein BH23CHL10_BH23CHL10_15340 [soil metagenome]
MFGHRGAVPPSVLDQHHQPDGPLMTGRDPIALLLVPAVLALEVEEKAINLGDDDLRGTKEPDIRRLAVIAGRNLELRSPRRVGDFTKPFRVAELARITKGWPPSTRIRLHHDIQPDRRSHGAERAELDAWIPLFHPPLGVC